MAGKVIVVESEDQFYKLLQDNALVVVDFHATWCGPCKMIAPKIEEMAKSMDNVVFLKVDVDDVEGLAANYEISCMPTFLFFKNNVKVDTFSGANEEKIRECVQKLVAA